MPNLRIETNVSAESIKDLSSFLSELSKAVSESTGKPEQYVVVQVCLHIIVLDNDLTVRSSRAFP